jgi:hypothetical protein
MPLPSYWSPYSCISYKNFICISLGPMHAACCALLILLDLIILLVTCEEYELLM